MCLHNITTDQLCTVLGSAMLGSQHTLPLPTPSWLVAVRKISAAQALLVAYQERLHRANEALMRTFQV